MRKETHKLKLPKEKEVFQPNALKDKEKGLGREDSSSERQSIAERLKESQDACQRTFYITVQKMYLCLTWYHHVCFTF